jgi:hypothetical protein
MLFQQVGNGVGEPLFTTGVGEPLFTTGTSSSTTTIRASSNFNKISVQSTWYREGLVLKALPVEMLDANRFQGEMEFCTSALRLVAVDVFSNIYALTRMRRASAPSTPLAAIPSKTLSAPASLKQSAHPRSHNLVDGLGFRV